VVVCIPHIIYVGISVNYATYGLLPQYCVHISLN